MTSYQSLLISYMLSPKYADFIKTFQEFKNSDMKVYEFPDDLGTHLNINLSFDKIVQQTELENDMISPFLMPQFVDTSLAYIISCNHADIFLKSDRNFENNLPLFSVLDEALVVYRHTNIYNVNSPFLNKLKPFADRILESGIKKVLKYEVERDDVGGYFALTMKSEVEKKIYLDFEDLKVPFNILIWGLSISFVVFVLELARNFIETRKLFKL